MRYELYYWVSPTTASGETQTAGNYTSLADATEAARAIARVRPELTKWGARTREPVFDGAGAKWADGYSYTIVLEPKYSPDAEIVREDGTTVWMKDVHSVFTLDEYVSFLADITDFLTRQGVDTAVIEKFKEHTAP